jgi:hypothetical protein
MRAHIIAGTCCQRASHAPNPHHPYRVKDIERVIASRVTFCSISSSTGSGRLGAGSQSA